MTDTLPPLTSAELAGLKLRAKHGEIYMKKTILRLITMIERRDEQIEKLHPFLKHRYSCSIRDLEPFDCNCGLAEALATTEPFNDKR